MSVRGRVDVDGIYRRLGMIAHRCCSAREAAGGRKAMAKQSGFWWDCTATLAVVVSIFRASPRIFPAACQFDQFDLLLN